jgi:beta-glucosidase
MADPDSLSRTVQVELNGGRTYDIRLEYFRTSGGRFAALRVFLIPPPPEGDSIAKAAELARKSDVALVFAGMPTYFETEGNDRPDMELPGQQVELIRAVAAANPRTVVVLNAGAPVSMPWLDAVPAVLEAYYPGQEGGNAVAGVLWGDVNPSGKLPVSFPKQLQDNPAYLYYPGQREVYYGEGIFVGYRYYDTRGVEPLFPFGHGLSYTTFEYSNLKVATSGKLGEPIEVSVTVKNNGSRAGKEVVQLYVSDRQSSLPRPVKELKGFKKVELQPGEGQVVSFSLDRRAFSFYDPYQSKWVAEPGEFAVLVGSSSHDIRLEQKLVLG